MGVQGPRDLNSDPHASMASALAADHLLSLHFLSLYIYVDILTIIHITAPFMGSVCFSRSQGIHR